MPAALSWADAAGTTTPMISPSTSTAASPRLRPDTFLLASSPVVVFGTPAAARTDWVSRITGDGSSKRRAFSPYPAAQELLNPLVKAVLAPQAEVVEHRRPGRRSMRQVAPLAARPVLAEDRVHDLPQIAGSGIFGR